MIRPVRRRPPPAAPPLRAHLTDRGLSLGTLARKTGCPRHHLAAVAAGRVNPGLGLCRRICDATGLTLTELAALLPGKEVPRA